MALGGQLERWVSGIRSKIASMVLKAIVQGVNDSNNIQLVHVTVLAGEEDSKVERVQNYGFTSSPPVGSEAIIAAIGGNQDHPVAIAVDSGAYRKKGLASGEVAMYHKDGAHILFKSNGMIQITAAGKDIQIVGGKVTMDANPVQLGGDSGFDKVMLESMIAKYNSHTHAETGGTTSVPTPLLVAGVDSTLNTEAK